MSEADFDRAGQGGTAAEGLASDRVPWDIGTPRPLLVEDERAGSVSGEVLERIALMPVLPLEARRLI